MPRAKTSEPAGLPGGFRYDPGFLSEEAESSLLAEFSRLEFQAFHFQGYVARRRILAYGFDYDFTSRETSPAKPIPHFLAALQEKAANWAGLSRNEIVEAVITQYPAGAPIGWHRDVPQFDLIIGVSLASDCRMKLKPYKKPGRIVSILLERRSIYMMQGTARWQFQHSIAPVKELRYSVTFRTLNSGFSQRNSST